MAIPRHLINQIHKELEIINQEWVDVRGSKLKAGNCYRFEVDPPHVLFNENCPEDLQTRVRNILSKYTGNNEIYTYGH